MRPGRLPRQSQITLAAALILLVLSAAQLGYRFSLPTDGWSVYTTEVERSDWLYDANLVGASSGLASGDVLQAVDGQSVQGTATSFFLERPPAWQAGQVVTMTILRSGERLSLPVPVVRWTAASWWRYNTGVPAQLAGLVGALLLFGIGWFTFLRRPEVPSARALLLLSTAVGAQSLSTTIPDGLSVQFDRLAFFATIFFSYAIFGTLLAPSLLAFSLLFPRPKQAIEHRPWLGLLPYGIGLIVLMVLVGGGPGIAGWFATLGMIVASILSLIHAAFTQRDSVSQAQLRWSLWGFVCGLGLFLLNFPVAFNWVSGQLVIDLLSAIASLGIPVVGVCLSVAVLRYRLFDIDVIIRRTLVYSVLTLLLALVYFGIVAVLQGVVAAAGREQSPLVIVLSTLAIAALVSPLRRRVQDFIDRRFYRRKYDAEQALARFSAAAREVVDVDHFAAELIALADETMQPASISLWMRPDPGKEKPIR